MSHTQEAMSLLADAMSELDSEQADWLTALFYAALDHTPDDPATAAKTAVKVMQSGKGPAMSTDARGHHHKGKGEGGGQFTSNDDSGDGEDKPKPAKKPPGSQMDERTKKRLRDLGMVGTFPPADVPAHAIKYADLDKDDEDLKYVALMSWQQTTRSGRTSPQYRYTQAFHERNAAEKHDRVAAIEPHIEEIQSILEDQMADESLTWKQREAAAIANIIRETGLRPTDGDDSIKHGHFGIASLQARHVKIKGDAIHLDFTGKEGVRNKAVVRDPANVAFLKEILEGASGKDEVWRAASSNDAGAALKAASVEAGGSNDVKIKDLRTLKAHQLAKRAVKNFKGPPPPLSGDPKRDAKLIASAILKMATEVSDVLNNKPTESRDTYVHPEIWREWQQSLTQKRGGD